jgi:hypothetical protein
MLPALKGWLVMYDPTEYTVRWEFELCKIILYIEAIISA